MVVSQHLQSTQALQRRCKQRRCQSLRYQKTAYTAIASLIFKLRKSTNPGTFTALWTTIHKIPFCGCHGRLIEPSKKKHSVMGSTIKSTHSQHRNSLLCFRDWLALCNRPQTLNRRAQLLDLKSPFHEMAQVPKPYAQMWRFHASDKPSALHHLQNTG